MTTRMPIAVTDPVLVKSKWDTAANENIGLTPSGVSRGSTKKAWWLCPEGHSWFAVISSVVRGHGCSYCSGKKVLPGFNDLMTTDPDVVDHYWDYAVNSGQGILPTMYTKGSGKVANWKCPDCGYTWDSRIIDVVRGYRCSPCGNAKIVPGINDIFTKRPDLLPKYRNDLCPEADVTKIGTGNSSDLLWWDCEEGHPYQQTAADICRGVGCGVCRGLQVHVGFNDFATRYPKEASRWNYILNGDLKPEDVSYGAGIYAWFTCDNGHDTYKYLPDTYRFGCRSCSSGTSKPEAEVREYIQGLIPTEEVIPNDRSIVSPKEIDIYIPSRSLAVEFNGVFTHSDYYKSREGVDARKAKSIRERGVKFHAVWEDDWRDRQEIVKSQLRRKLGIQDGKVFARKRIIREVGTDEARLFLDRYHIQGFPGSSRYVALVDTENIVDSLAAFTFYRSGEVVLDRYASRITVLGGLPKIVSYLEKTYVYDHLVTFADLQESDGDLYRTTGWDLDQELPPDYKYLVGGRYREDKRKYRVENFRNNPTLKYEEGATEAQLAAMNKLTRVYDYGKLRFVKPHPGKDN